MAARSCGSLQARATGHVTMASLITGCCIPQTSHSPVCCTALRTHGNTQTFEAARRAVPTASLVDTKVSDRMPAPQTHPWIPAVGPPSQVTSPPSRAFRSRERRFKSCGAPADNRARLIVTS
jgi:hypothetical protein